jgi:hypothetical protein
MRSDINGMMRADQSSFLAQLRPRLHQDLNSVQYPLISQLIKPNKVSKRKKKIQRIPAAAASIDSSAATFLAFFVFTKATP